MKKIAIIMGSDSEFPVVRAAADTLQELEIPFEVHVYSAHRTPEAVQAFVSAARQNGFGVIIAAAGKAAHLAGALFSIDIWMLFCLLARSYIVSLISR